MHLTENMDDVKVFIDDTGVIGKSTFAAHIEQLDKVLTKMKEAGLQINIRKTKWAVNEANYLGFIVSKEGYSPDPKKIKGLVQMKPPKNKRQVRRFIGGVNFYRKMWKN